MSITKFVVAIAITAASAVTTSAQVNYEPSRYPAITAADREWFREKQAILFAGDAYWPVGPDVYFQPDLMVVTGEFDGVPLFADKSLPPYDQVLVPLGGDRLRPYERKREGRLAGTSGGRTSVPVADTAATWSVDQAAPSDAPQGRRGGTSTPQQPPRQPAPPDDTPVVTGPTVETVRRPQGTRGIWVRFEGARWESTGEAVLYDPKAFTAAGTYFGFPVYRRKPAGGAATSLDEIYLRSRDGVVAPYRRVADSR